MRADLIRGHLEMLVLSTITSGAGHGYAIVEELRRRSDGEFDLPEGTVYPALYRLESSGLLRSEWQSVSGRRRRVYGLTPAGRKALARKAREWDLFIAAVARVVGRVAWAGES